MEQVDHGSIQKMRVVSGKVTPQVVGSRLRHTVYVSGVCHPHHICAADHLLLRDRPGAGPWGRSGVVLCVAGSMLHSGDCSGAHVPSGWRKRSSTRRRLLCERGGYGYSGCRWLPRERLPLYERVDAPQSPDQSIRIRNGKRDLFAPGTGSSSSSAFLPPRHSD